MRRSAGFIFIVPAAMLLLAGCLADLRPEGMAIVQESRDGKTLLLDACKRHGLTVWGEHQIYTVTFRDQFVGLKGWYANAFREKPVELQCTFAIGRFEGEIEFLSGKKKGEIWGFMNNKTYKILPGGANITKENKHIRFWIPTIQYFIEFPLRILEADVVAYAGETSREGNTYDLVMASWKTLEPQKEIDQYLVWINRNSGMIDLIQYTVRDYFKWYRGTSVFDAVQNFEGVQLPTSFPVFTTRPGKGKVHHMRLENFRFLDSDDLPDPDSTELSVPVNTDPATTFVEVSRIAVDRNCGSCHHSDRSENATALEIFNLADSCWYCTISADQITGLENRTQGSENFSEEEQEAIRKVIAEIN